LRRVGAVGFDAAMKSLRIGTIASLCTLGFVSASAFAVPACTTASDSTTDAAVTPGDDTGALGDTTPSGDDAQSETPAETGEPTIDSACADEAAAFCARLDACANYTVRSVYGSKAKCAERVKVLCLARAAAPKSGLTVSNLGVCATALASITCPDLERDNLPASCRPAGAADPGAPCGDDAQCPAGHFCALAAGKSCGTCTRLEVGGPCAANGRCPDGTVCSGGECKVYDPMACTTGGACLPDQSCVADKCVENLTTAGAACGFGNGLDCSNWAGLVCDSRTGGGSNTCVTMQLASPGENCSMATTGASFPIDCNSGGACDGTTATCFAALDDGAACGSSVALCMPPAVCDGTSKKCTLPDYSLCK
jgi:hypothetical protein